MYLGLNTYDWLVIAIYFCIVFMIAFFYTKKAGKDTSQFFLSGRNMPWWLAGTAMVATTFAADTPLAVTELVAKNGIAGNWLWWNLAIGGMLTVFFFAKLWRRAGILTDVEFVEMRYSGKPAAFLRGFRALYLGLFMNSIVLAWVNKAMEKIFQVTIPGVDAFLLVIICMVLISVYASASGLLGTARIDALQFLIAMAGCIILAFIVLDIPEVGGINGIKNQLSDWVFEFTPVLGSSSIDPLLGGTLAISVGAFIAHIGLQWWSSWYPGADPGGGGYVAQRIMSAKNESHSLFATLWFTIAHYCVRPWPWIIVALAGLVLLPRFSADQIKDQNIINEYSAAFEIYQEHLSTSSDLSLYSDNPELLHKIKAFENKEFFESYENTVDPGKIFPKLMVKYLPEGLLGLLIAVFLAAYMSTIASQLNWGTSYLVNDFYKRFVKPMESEKHYVFASRIIIILLMISSLLITNYLLNTISGAWEFIINASAGIGAVLILRWYWWRINAWSEISAMIAPLIIYPVAHYGFDLQSPLTLYPTVIGTTIIWVSVTLLTEPTNEKVLKNFYYKIHPGGYGWKTYKERYPEVISDTGYGKLFINWIAGVVVVYAFLYSTGQFIFMEYKAAFISLFIGIIAAFLIYRNLFKSPAEN
ncbi:MAG: Na+:solute symporter [Melioribacteraceae bacterium]|nr:Na+:solute symporter [Melioribacteraceae bacterium]